MDVTNIENLDGFIYYLSKRQKNKLPRRPCRPAAAAVSLGRQADGQCVRNLQGGIGEKDGLADSASRDPQGGAGEKDVLETVVTRHEFHGEPVPARLHLISDRVASVPSALKI